jgi:uncharacterized membrane protein
MISRLPKIKIGLIAPIFILVIPFLTFVQVTNPVISFLLLLMISLLPGMAILELFNFSFYSLTTRFFYALLFSILFLMTVFTIYSTISHASGIKAPLSTVPVKIICLIILSRASSFLLRRLADRDSSSLKLFNWVFFLPRIIAVFLPIVSLICVMRINSFSDATSTSIFLILLLAFFLLITVKSSFATDTNLQAWFIYGISAALVLGSTFRGDGGFWGFDINQEFASASKVLSQGFWVPPKVSSAYDSMLSITVLPVVLSLFSNLSLTIIFKIFYALVLACIPTVLYVASVKYASRFSAMVVTGALIIGSISFIPQMTALMRQVIGLTFFVGILLVLNEKGWSRRRQKTVGLIMASGMAISHYSTAYLASTVFFISIIASVILFLVSPKRFRQRNQVFTPAFSITLILITVLWNGVITQSLQDVKPVFERTFSQGIDFLPNQNQSLWTRWFSGSLSTGTQNLESPSDLQNQIRTIDLGRNEKFGITPIPDSLNYQIQLAVVPNPKALFGEKVASVYSNILIFGRSFFQFSAFLGLFLLSRKLLGLGQSVIESSRTLDRNQSLDILVIGIAALIVGFIARTSGTLVPSYNPERVALQITIVLLIPTAIAIEHFLFRREFIQIFLAVPILFFFMVLLLQATSLGGYVTGSDVSRISNLQSDYSPFIISENEREASRWVAGNIPNSAFLQTDTRGFLAILQTGRRTELASLNPVNLVKGSYIYATNSNIVGNVARTSLGLILFPEDYIDQHYQIIYSSNRARVYH